MKTAVDTSVLHAIFNAEPDAQVWLRILVQARREGRLVVCDVVYAELAPAFPDEETLMTQLERLGIAFDPILPTTAFFAGQTFLRYRDAGGPRTHLIPDFLIAAHALKQADRLAATDRGYVRRYFAELPLLTLPDQRDTRRRK